MNAGQKIAYFLLKWVSIIFGILPYYVLYYPVLWMIYFIMYKIVGYRVAVVRSNLERVFPELKEKERKDIERKFYFNLAEIFVDTIDFVGITRKQARRRIKIENIDEHHANTSGKDYICAMAHYGNWEFTNFYNLISSSHQIVAIYKPLHSKIFDDFFKRTRTKFGADVVPMAEVIRYMLNHLRRKDDKKIMIGMIADQVPMRRMHPATVEFLGQKTLFYTGIEKMALKFKLPVYFLDIKKHGRSKYTFGFVQIYDGKEEVETDEITRRYATHLEAMIRRCPELWLWSHRRWKR